ncbi:class I SAM-dependent methyltransferase [Tautonia plasticadhaerens]|uniref:Putative S-adenosylmethionine-dependent methyltransferase/MSMEI_2290 n=1 Tax=Tautonia plasticadhaerens TaxID=2527974 RepID=A0A518GVD5_9BACT|nr:class I SAM-dependent methyltransferase [Tautonia plasticadhaerens]QDV32544.1 putative S-adenosylmethionine-dependent methyltransferase/MSMEI_2290 [Tautonia plasticadhaerens]
MAEAQARRIELFGLEITGDDVVLDIGSGTGGDSRLAGSVGADVIAVNIDPGELESLGEQMKDVPARSFRPVLHDCDAGPIPLPDGVASVIIAKEVMEHLDAPDRFLADLERLGRPGARYLITVPDPGSEALLKEVAPQQYWEKPLHQHVFVREQLDRMLGVAGLELERRGFTGAYWSMFWTLRELVGSPYFPGHPTHSTPPPEIAAWDLIWESIRSSPKAAGVINRLDELIPKSQIVLAKKPKAAAAA